MPVIPALPWAGKHAGGFCVSRSFLALGGSQETWAFLCSPVNITSVPPCRLSGCWVLRSRALLAGDGQTSSWKHFLWTSLSRTQTRVSLAGPRPPRWQQHRLLGMHRLLRSVAWGSRSLSPQKHSASRTRVPGPPARPAHVGLSRGCPCPHIFSFFQRYKMAAWQPLGLASGFCLVLTVLFVCDLN